MNKEDLNSIETISNEQHNDGISKTICPSCGFQIDGFPKTCPECGHTFTSTNKKKKKIILIIILAVVVSALFIILGILGFNQYQIYQSTQNYQNAQTHEEKNDYETAVALYSLVIETDKENYAKAQEKIVELNEKIDWFKCCAKAWVAADSVCPYFDADSIKNIYYAEDNSAYALMYGDDTVSIVSPFLSTDCTFVISNTQAPSLTEYYPVYYNSDFNLYIHAIGVDNYTKGWLSSGFDIVTDSYVTMAKEFCTELDIVNIQKYVDEYYETKDVNVFE